MLDSVDQTNNQIEGAEIVQKLGTMLQDDLLQGTKEYVDKLLEKYPKESHVFVTLGPQNFLTNAYLKYRLGEEDFNKQVFPRPLRNIRKCYSPENLEKLFPNKESIGNKKLVIIRKLSAMQTVSSGMEHYNKFMNEERKGIKYAYYFTIDTSEFHENKSDLPDNDVAIKKIKDSSEYKNITDKKNVSLTIWPEKKHTIASEKDGVDASDRLHMLYDLKVDVTPIIDLKIFRKQQADQMWSGSTNHKYVMELIKQREAKYKE